MKILQAVDLWIERIVGWVLVLLLSLMIVMAFAQVILRNFFSSGILWGDIFLRHLVLWLGFLGAAIATGENRHIKVDFLTRFLSPKARKILAVLTSLFALFICYELLQASIVFMNIGIDSRSTLILNIPTLYFVAIIPMGYGLIGFRLVVITIEWGIEIAQGNWAVRGGR